MSDADSQTYERPQLVKYGNVESVTAGQHFSNPDGKSGGVGNRGNN